MKSAGKTTESSNEGKINDATRYCLKQTAYVYAVLKVIVAL